MCALWLCYRRGVWTMCSLGVLQCTESVKSRCLSDTFVVCMCTLRFIRRRRVYIVYVHHASPYAMRAGGRTIYVFLCVLLCAVSVKSRCFLLYVCTMRVMCRNVCTKCVLRAGAYSDAPCWWNHVSLLTVYSLCSSRCVCYIYICTTCVLLKCVCVRTQ